MDKYVLDYLIGEEKPTDSSTHDTALISLVEICKFMNLALDLHTLLNALIQMTPGILASDEASINLLTENKKEITQMLQYRTRPGILPNPCNCGLRG